MCFKGTGALGGLPHVQPASVCVSASMHIFLHGRVYGCAGAKRGSNVF